MDTVLKRKAVGVLAAVLLAVTSLVGIVGIVGSAGVAGASVSNSQNLPPIYSNWPQNSTNWPCYATPSYACTQGGYSAAAAESSGWPWSEYGGGNASYNTYGPHNCTLYAAFRLADNGLGDPGALGNAAQWASDAAAKGFAVDQTPAVGSIAQWNAGGGGDGHVAYVESVDPGGTGITITEDNYVPASAANFPGGYTAEVHITAGSSVWPANFIHFNDQGVGGPPPTANGGSAIVSAYANNCVDVPGASTTLGTQLQMFTCDGLAQQQWIQRSDGALQVYANDCMDVTGASTTPGTPVQLYTCNGGPQQHGRSTPTEPSPTLQGCALTSRGDRPPTERCSSCGRATGALGSNGLVPLGLTAALPS